MLGPQQNGLFTDGPTLSFLFLASPTGRASGPTWLGSPPSVMFYENQVLFTDPLDNASVTLKGEGPGRGGEKHKIWEKADLGPNPSSADV